MALNLPDVPAGILTPAVKVAIIAREDAIVARVNSGAMDPIEWLPVDASGNGRRLTLYALKQPLSFDGVFVGMSAYCLQQCADRLGAMLHTPKTLDLSYLARGVTITPQTMWDANRMMTNEWFMRHSDRIHAAISQAGGNGIVFSTGKPWVLINGLEAAMGRACNYGWHLPPGVGLGGNWLGAPAYQSVTLPNVRVLQQPGTTHEFRYQADYSETGYLLRGDCELDGNRTTVRAVASDSSTASLVCHEGILRVFRQPGVPGFGGGGSNLVEPHSGNQEELSTDSSKDLKTAAIVGAVIAVASGVAWGLRKSRRR